MRAIHQRALANWGSYAAQSSVPKSRFTLGVPFYAHNSGGWGNVITYAQVMDQFNPAPNLDNTNGWYFNGKDTIANKTSFVLNNGYGGVMVWETGQDHFTATITIRRRSAGDQIDVGLTAFTTLTSGNLVATGDANVNTFSLAVSGSNLEITLGNTTANVRGGEHQLDHNRRARWQRFADDQRRRSTNR